jgi:hypothetical protein
MVPIIIEVRTGEAENPYKRVGKFLTIKVFGSF